MVHLDTHAVIWLYQGRVDAFPPRLREAIGVVQPMVCPMVRLELALLREIGRLNVEADALLVALEEQIGLRTAESSFDRVVRIAAGLAWTRDPFDRLIAAHAMADDVPLVTRDETLLAHCPVARWG